VLQGTADKPGLVPLALRDIFQTISREGHNAHRVSLSVCEVRRYRACNNCKHIAAVEPDLCTA
jgi:hypothetical protein